MENLTGCLLKHTETTTMKSLVHYPEYVHDTSLYNRDGLFCASPHREGILTL